jgi:hypothetical protein
MKELILLRFLAELMMLVVFVLLVVLGWSVIEWLNWVFITLGVGFITYKIIQRQ